MGVVRGKINTGLPGAITTVAPDDWPTMTTKAKPLGLSTRRHSLESEG